MKKFWRKSGDNDYICELREKKNNAELPTQSHGRLRKPCSTQRRTEQNREGQEERMFTDF